MRKISKIIIVFTVMINLIIIPLNSFAQDVGYSSLSSSSILDNNKYENIIDWEITSDAFLPEDVLEIVGLAISFLRNISMISTVLIITILGIKFMIGSVEQKAEYKKSYINIIIGVVLITSIFSIVDFILSITKTV